MADRSPEKEQRWTIPICESCGKPWKAGSHFSCEPRSRSLQVVPADHPLLLAPEEATLLGGYEDVMTVDQLEAKNAIRKRLRDYAGEKSEGGGG